MPDLRVLILTTYQESDLIFNCLRASNVKLDAPSQPKGSFHAVADHRCQLDFLAVQVLTRQLRQSVYLCVERTRDVGVRITEVHGRVPHLEIQIAGAAYIEEIAAFAPVEDLRSFRVVNRITVGTNASFAVQELALGYRRGAWEMVRGRHRLTSVTHRNAKRSSSVSTTKSRGKQNASFGE